MFTIHAKTLTLKELAQITQIDVPRWSRYISGKVLMTEDTIYKCSHALGVSAGDFLTALDIARKRHPRNNQVSA